MYFSSFPRIIHQLNDLRAGHGAVRLSQKIGSLRFRISEKHVKFFQPFWADSLPRLAYNNPQIDIQITKIPDNEQESLFVLCDLNGNSTIERTLSWQSAEQGSKGSKEILEKLVEASLEFEK